MPCQYTNSKGKVVVVFVTKHALSRFMERRPKIGGCPIDVECAKKMIEESFNRAERITSLNRKLRERAEKYKGNTMYFRSDGMFFVVENRSIVTVEISIKKKRWMN